MRAQPKISPGWVTSYSLQLLYDTDKASLYFLYILDVHRRAYRRRTHIQDVLSTMAGTAAQGPRLMLKAFAATTRRRSVLIEELVSATSTSATPYSNSSASATSAWPSTSSTGGRSASSSHQGSQASSRRDSAVHFTDSFIGCAGGVGSNPTSSDSLGDRRSTWRRSSSIERLFDRPMRGSLTGGVINRLHGSVSTTEGQGVSEEGGSGQWPTSDEGPTSLGFQVSARDNLKKTAANVAAARKLPRAARKSDSVCLGNGSWGGAECLLPGIPASSVGSRQPPHRRATFTLPGIIRDGAPALVMAPVGRSAESIIGADVGNASSFPSNDRGFAQFAGSTRSMALAEHSIASSPPTKNAKASPQSKIGVLPAIPNKRFGRGVSSLMSRQVDDACHSDHPQQKPYQPMQSIV